LIELDEFHLANTRLFTLAELAVIDVTTAVLDFGLSVEFSIDPKPFKDIAILIH